MKIQTNRLIITKFDLSMAESVHKNSLDEDNRKFLPDEVFETVEEAKETINFLMNAYKSIDGPFVYPVLLKDEKINIGHVQLVRVEDGFEVGYHIAKEYTNKGYATEALKALLCDIMIKKNLDFVYGICVAENISSRKVLEKCGFKKEYEGPGNYHDETRQIAKYILKKS